MNTILDALVSNASELAVFFITAGAAWIKRRYDLKKIQQEEIDKNWARSTK